MDFCAMMCFMWLWVVASVLLSVLLAYCVHCAYTYVKVRACQALKAHVGGWTLGWVDDILVSVALTMGAEVA